MDENPIDQSSGTENPVPQKSDSVLSKIKFKFNPPPLVQRFVIPTVIVLIILVAGGGGTYLVASSVLGSKTSSNGVSKISEADIPAVPSSAISPPSPTPTPTLSPTPVVIEVKKKINQTSLPSIVNSWPSYTFTAVNMVFKYPSLWTVSLGSTSGAPYLYIQNFAGSIPSTYSNGQYAIFISRLEQVGITSISGLTTQLALNNVSNTSINGVNYGTATVVSSESLTLGGKNAYKRKVNYSSFPNTEYTELYILDGVSNVIKFMPLLDTSWGKPYFDLIVGTVTFTN